MVAVFEVLRFFRLDVISAQFSVVGTGLGVQHGHALLGEIEMIGAVVFAVFRVLLGFDDAILRRCLIAQDILEFGTAVSDHDHVVGRSVNVHGVHVDTADRIAHGHSRVVRVVG